MTRPRRRATPLRPSGSAHTGFCADECPLRGRERAQWRRPPPRRGVTQYASTTVKETTRDDLGHRHQRAHRSPGSDPGARVRRDGTTGGDLTDHDFRTLAADLSLTLEAVAALLRSVGVRSHAATHGLLTVAEHVDMGALMARRGQRRARRAAAAGHAPRARALWVHGQLTGEEAPCHCGAGRGRRVSVIRLLGTLLAGGRPPLPPVRTRGTAVVRGDLAAPTVMCFPESTAHVFLGSALPACEGSATCCEH